MKHIPIIYTTNSSITFVDTAEVDSFPFPEGEILGEITLEEREFLHQEAESGKDIRAYINKEGKKVPGAFDLPQPSEYHIWSEELADWELPLESEEDYEKSLVPSQVTRAQGKVVLIQMGLWNSIIQYVEAIEDPVEKAIAEVALNDTLHWERNSPVLGQIYTQLGLTEEQVDQMFIQASEINL